MTDVLIINARLIDPASGLDAMGGLLVRDGRILDFGPALGRPDGVEVVDAGGRCCAPGWWTCGLSWASRNCFRTTEVGFGGEQVAVGWKCVSTRR